MCTICVWGGGGCVCVCMYVCVCLRACVFACVCCCCCLAIRTLRFCMRCTTYSETSGILVHVATTAVMTAVLLTVGVINRFWFLLLQHELGAYACDEPHLQRNVPCGGLVPHPHWLRQEKRQENLALQASPAHGWTEPLAAHQKGEWHIRKRGTKVQPSKLAPPTDGMNHWRLIKRVSDISGKEAPKYGPPS